MTAFSDRMREATVLLRPDYGEVVQKAVAELAALQNLRPTDLLSVARVAFPAVARPQDYDLVRGLFNRRGLEGGTQHRQLWSTVACLLLIDRFDRGPGRRSHAKLLSDSVAATAVEVLTNHGFKPVHPDLSTGRCFGPS